MQKEKQLVHQLTVYDADEDKLVEISKEQQLEAMAVFQQIQAGVFISALGIKRMVDKKLYLAMNIQSKDQFLSTLEAFGRRQAYKLLAVATRFENVFGDKLLATGTSTAENEEGAVNKFDGLGIAKLYEITRLEDAEILELAEGGEINIGDGKYTIDDLKRMGFKKLEEQFSKSKKKMQDEIAILSEENKTLKEEVKIKNKQIEGADKKIEDAKELEIKYGPIAKTNAHKDFLLKGCWDSLNAFHDDIIKANVLPNDSERIRKQLTDIVKKLDTVTKIVGDAYQEITSEF